MFENYHEGKGHRGFPFYGWTSLIANIISEIYWMIIMLMKNNIIINTSLIANIISEIYWMIMLMKIMIIMLMKIILL